MSAAQEAYMQAIYRELSDFTYKHCFKEQRNIRDKKLNILKLCLLQAYVDVMYQYFSAVITEDINFFTRPEIEDIMQGMNNITKKNYWTIIT